jgi:hypothetical protein
MPFLWHALCHVCTGGPMSSRAVAAVEKATPYVLFRERERNLEGGHPSNASRRSRLAATAGGRSSGRGAGG